MTARLFLCRSRLFRLEREIWDVLLRGRRVAEPLSRGSEVVVVFE